MMETMKFESCIRHQCLMYTTQQKKVRMNLVQIFIIYRFQWFHQPFGEVLVNSITGRFESSKFMSIEINAI